MVLSNIEKAKDMLLTGGDWDRKNRLKVYEGWCFYLFIYFYFFLFSPFSIL